MLNISKLEGLKRKAKKEGWADFIRTPADEEALLKGYYFSWEKFDHFRYYVETYMKLGKGRWEGKPAYLLAWHEVVCGSIFGWLSPEGLRRFKRGYVEIPKKNSKTTLFSWIGLYMADPEGDGEGSPEVYNCANDKGQAEILWSMAADCVDADSELGERFDPIRSTKRIRVTNNTKAWFAAWSSDKTGKDGPNAHCLLVDELHEWKGNEARDFWGKIRYAGIAREQPLCPFVITTAGDDEYSLCFEQRTVAKKIIEGISKELTFFACIYGADEQKIKNDPDYWKTEACWKEANPAYGEILKKEDFEADVAEVENDPVAKSRFLRYRLGVWVASSTPWLKAGVWDKNYGPGFDESDLKGQLSFLGLDMSSVDDFTSYCLAFPYFTQMEVKNEKGIYELKYVKKFKKIWRIFCPEDGFSERVRLDETGQFRLWHEQGYIILTPGSSIDHNFIFDEIKADSEYFQIKEGGYDRNSAAWIIQEMQKQLPHIELFPFNQSMVGMSSPTKALKAVLMKGYVEHNGNPVPRWSASHAKVVTDNHANEMLIKTKDKKKIDPLIAGVMAYAHAELGSMHLEKQFSAYSNEGFQVIKELEGIKDKQAEKKNDSGNNSVY